MEKEDTGHFTGIFRRSFYSTLLLLQLKIVIEAEERDLFWRKIEM